MFCTKRRKIQIYLASHNACDAQPFCSVLRAGLSGELKAWFTGMGFKKVSIHIDWLDDYRCVGVQGVFSGYYLDLQIEPTQFSVGYDPDEPDEHRYYPLESPDQIYEVVQQTIQA